MERQERPTTSTQRLGSSLNKRPKTAGRNNERPPTLGSVIRSSAFPVDSRAHSQIQEDGIIAPGSRMGSRINKPQSRAESRRVMAPSTSSGPSMMMMNNRPLTAHRQIVPPTPGSGQQRSITQQGLSGARASSRMGTALGGRMVADSTYYLGLLKAKLNSLDTEIASLTTELDKNEKSQQNLLAYEQMAEETANELRNMQGELTDYNMIIDRQNTNANIQNLGDEVKEEEKSNLEISGKVEELFRERKEKEAKLQEIESMIDHIQANNSEKMEKMEGQLKQEFEEITAEAEHLRSELQAKQAELESLNRSKEEMDIGLARSTLKQQAMVLEEQIQELEERKKAVYNDLHSDETPEIQRSALVERIQRNNEEIANMQSQIQEIGEQQKQAQEELKEFQSEFETTIGDKNERFRDLKLRDARISAFIENFDEIKRANQKHIDTLSEMVVRLLTLISMNCRHNELAANVSDLDESMLGINSTTIASASELQDLHVRLQEELISLEQNEALLKSELVGIERQMNEIKTKFSHIGEVDILKDKIKDQKQDLQKQNDQLYLELNKIEGENQLLHNQFTTSEQQFSTSPHLTKLKELKIKVDRLEEERKVLQTKHQTMLAENDYTALKHEVLEMRAEYNRVLISKINNTK